MRALWLRLSCWTLGHQYAAMTMEYRANAHAPLKVCRRCGRPAQVDLTGCE